MTTEYDFSDIYVPTPLEVARKMIEDSKKTIVSLDDYLVLRDISCVDADGTIFEEYPEIYIKKDVERNRENSLILNPYSAAVYFEQQGLFLPSFALSCNIVVTLYKNKINADCKKILDQYKDHGAGHGWHAQNTLIDWEINKIIHYPHDADFPRYGGSNGINQSQSRTSFDFNKKGISDMTLEKALKKPNFEKYIRNLTGLVDPSNLIRIGVYFGKTAHCWTSSSNENGTRATWFGCNDSGFNRNANYILDNTGACRGVFLNKS